MHKTDEIEILRIKELWLNMIHLFEKEVFCLKKACDSKLQWGYQETKILLASACNTWTAIVVLWKNTEYFFTEIMMLSRSFLEKLVNFYYLQVCDKEDKRKFLAHPWYRQYHNMNISKKAWKHRMEISYSGIESFKKDPKVIESLEIFSEKNPRLNRSNKTLSEKLDIIATSTKLWTDMWMFLLNNLQIYSNASESLHGSLFGCTYHMWVYDPSINHTDISVLNINLLKHTVVLYSGMVSLIHSIIKVIKQNIPEEIRKDSELNSKNCLLLLKNLLKK